MHPPGPGSELLLGAHTYAGGTEQELGKEVGVSCIDPLGRVLSSPILREECLTQEETEALESE